MKRKHLPGICTGETIMAFGVTEPNAGTDTSRIQTRAVKQGDRWIVNGRKVWTTNAQHATKSCSSPAPPTRDPARPLKGMTLFFTAFDRTAITVREIEKLGRAAVDSNEIVIENLEIPEEDVVGNGGRRLLPPARLAQSRAHRGRHRGGGHRPGRAGARRPVRQGARSSSTGPSGRTRPSPIRWRTPRPQLDAAELLCLKAAWLFDTGRPCGREANAAKLLAAEAGFNACDAALQTFGGFGYAKEFYVERLWREVRLYKIAPVSQQMALNYLAEHVLGLPRSY